jgi:general stress protein 26
MKPDVKLHELLQQFDTAMLVTRTHNGNLRARPMALAEMEPDGTVWFVASRNSDEVKELSQDSHIAVAMQSRTQYVSLSGTGKPIEDRQRIARLWKAEWKAWFPGGNDDPGLVLIRVDGQEWEYWDANASKGAVTTSPKPAAGGDPKVHGKVDLKEAAQ